MYSLNYFVYKRTHVLLHVEAGEDGRESGGKFLNVNGTVAVLVQASHQLEHLFEAKQMRSCEREAHGGEKTAECIM